MRIVIDTETTGLNPESGDEILQVSIIDADTKQVLFNELMRPKMVTSWDEAQAVNGITPEMVADKPTIDAYAYRIQSILSDSTEIIGYNTIFDINFLSVSAGIDPPWGAKIIDVMQDYAKCYGIWSDKQHGYKWVKLVDATEHFGYDWDAAPAHNSLGDVFATLAVYEAMRDKNLYYIAQAFYADGTNAKGIAEHVGHAQRMLYQMEQRREDIVRSQLIAIDQDGKPKLMIQHPPF